MLRPLLEAGTGNHTRLQFKTHHHAGFWSWSWAGKSWPDCFGLGAEERAVGFQTDLGPQFKNKTKQKGSDDESFKITVLLASALLLISAIWTELYGAPPVAVPSKSKLPELSTGHRSTLLSQLAAHDIQSKFLNIFPALQGLLAEFPAGSRTFEGVQHLAPCAVEEDNALFTLRISGIPSVSVYTHHPS